MKTGCSYSVRHFLVTGRTGILLLCCLQTGCVYMGRSIVHNKDVCAERNRSRLEKICEGHFKEDVYKIMGTQECCLGDDFGGLTGRPDIIRNPYYVMEFELDDGDILEVAYYFTFSVTAGDHLGRNELTPLVFRNDVLIGWGRPFLERLVAGRSVQRSRKLGGEWFVSFESRVEGVGLTPEVP